MLFDLRQLFCHVISLRDKILPTLAKHDLRFAVQRSPQVLVHRGAVIRPTVIPVGQMPCIWAITYDEPIMLYRK